MISNRCARKSLLINCNSIISKNYLRFLVDNNVKYILIGLQKYYKTEQNGKNVIFLTMIKMCKK